MADPFDPYHRWLGIPPKQQPANFYRLLGIELFESDVEVIRDAAEQRMAHVRTYQLGKHSELSQKILNELAGAKARLQDPAEKAAYDALLRATFVGQSPSVAGSSPPARDLSDLLNEAEREAAPLPPVVKPGKRRRPAWLFTGARTARQPPPPTFSAPSPHPARLPRSVWTLVGVPAAAVAVVLGLLLWFSGNAKVILKTMGVVFQQLDAPSERTSPEKPSPQFEGQKGGPKGDAPLFGTPQAEMESWWTDLEKLDPEASRTLLKVAAKPQEAVAFLGKKMRPLKIDAGQVKTLLLKLGSDKEEVWKPAFEELEYFDPRLAIDLETLMKDVTDSPARQRMVELLGSEPAGSQQGKQIILRREGPDQFSFFDGHASWWAEHQVSRIKSGFWRPKKKWLRALRAMMLLERISTSDALAILKEMATGHPDVQPTIVAKEIVKGPKADAPLFGTPQAEMESWWTDLEKPDPEASRALLKLAAKPQEAVAFLRKKMRPLKIDAGQVKTLLLKLGSDKEEVWKPAFEELEYLDPRLAIDIETLMKDVTDSPARQRMVELLVGAPAGSLQGKQIILRSVGPDMFNLFDGHGSWGVEHHVSRLKSEFWNDPKTKWSRALLAMMLLEHIGTSDALGILKEMATGHPDAQPTMVAKEILAAHAAGPKGDAPLFGTPSLVLAPIPDVRLEAGASRDIAIQVERKGCQGAVSVNWEGLPQNVSVKEGTIPTGWDSASFQLNATANAQEAESEIHVVAALAGVTTEQRFKLAVTKPAPAEQSKAATPDKPIPHPSPAPEPVQPRKKETPPLAEAVIDPAQARAHQERWAAHQNVPVEIINSIGMKMIIIPAGILVQGRLGDQRVKIEKPFYIGVYEVTQGQFRRVTGKNPSHFPIRQNPQGRLMQRFSNILPVEMVTWLDAVDFCNRLSIAEKLPPYYLIQNNSAAVAGGQGYRLPSPEEWLFAATGGNGSAWSLDSRKWNAYAWFRDNAGDMTHPVGQKTPGMFGLCDTYGNVWEYCGLPPGSFRGHCYHASAENLNEHGICCNGPDYRASDVGFRVARSVPDLPAAAQ
jgi:formylglycine-generating enzyme required for sulfatase activity